MSKRIKDDKKEKTKKRKVYEERQEQNIERAMKDSKMNAQKAENYRQTYKTRHIDDIPEIDLSEDPSDIEFDDKNKEERKYTEQIKEKVREHTTSVKRLRSTVLTLKQRKLYQIDQQVFGVQTEDELDRAIQTEIQIEKLLGIYLMPVIVGEIEYYETQIKSFLKNKETLEESLKGSIDTGNLNIPYYINRNKKHLENAHYNLRESQKLLRDMIELRSIADHEKKKYIYN